MKYSLQQLRELNSETYHHIDPELHRFFNRIHKNKYLHGYLNPYNKYLCPPGQRKHLFPKADAFSDQKLVEDLKTILSKVTEQNKDEITNKLKRIPFTESSWTHIVPMLHQVTIDCIFIIDTLLEIIIFLNNEHHPTLLDEYKALVVDEFEHPRQFENNPLSLESYVDKEKRWILSNNRILASMYCKDLFDHDFFNQSILQPILEHITPENTLGIDVLNLIYPLIKEHLPSDISQDLRNNLTQISEDIEYPTRLRFLVLDLLELF